VLFAERWASVVPGVPRDCVVTLSRKAAGTVGISSSDPLEQEITGAARSSPLLKGLGRAVGVEFIFEGVLLPAVRGALITGAVGATTVRLAVGVDVADDDDAADSLSTKPFSPAPLLAEGLDALGGALEGNGTPADEYRADASGLSDDPPKFSSAARLRLELLLEPSWPPPSFGRCRLVPD